jgi:hypothetical protein
MDGDALDRLRRWFPALNDENARVTSPISDAYNCVAWAMGDTERWWQREHAWKPWEWPAELPDDHSPGSWVKLFQLAGFEVCQDTALEKGFEKVAIYVTRDWREATHVARQLPSGAWTSKLGPLEDIEHGSPELLEGADYGVVGIVLRRSCGA